MSQKLFRAHIEDVKRAPPHDVSNICKTDDNVVSFNFQYSKNGWFKSVTIQALATPVEEYTDGHTYFLYTNETDPDPVVAQSLDLLTTEVVGEPLPAVISRVAEALKHATTLGQARNPIALDDDENEDEQEFDFEEDFDHGDDDDFGFTDFQKHRKANDVSDHDRGQNSVFDVDLVRVRSDLQAAKDAGFRVGILGDLTHGGIVCISARIAKLGISEEAMQAWNLKREQYIVLMIRFPQGYRTLQDVQNEARPSQEMRVALCRSYKPTLDHALSAFSQLPVQGYSNSREGGFQEEGRSLEALFIGQPLNDLLRERFTRILAIRDTYGLSWFGAEHLYNANQGRKLAANEGVDDCYYQNDGCDRTLPTLVTADQFEEIKARYQLSLPLVAMQFVLRHFVRCTEFCLICHCKTQDDFEALKPYVCSKPLCLFQYMGLGFGPSIEWEILSQPRVVDLLISFCYVSANTGFLQEFPLGIGLKVPVLPSFNNVRDTHYRGHTAVATNTSGTTDAPPPLPRPIRARQNRDTGELILAMENKKDTDVIRAGDWIAIAECNEKPAPLNTQEYRHYCVEDVLFPKLRVGTFKPNQETWNPTEALSTSEQWIDVDVLKYDQDFDGLSDNQKRWAITTVLDTLPKLTEMRDYLEVSQKGRDPNLRKWRSNISEAALNLLRWIIASNRSCIMQVDDLKEDIDAGHSYGNPVDHVSGMNEYMRFRFAQGAPDKEQRFEDAIDENTPKQHHFRTLFAFHGSPLWNWHSIIREGLHYKTIMHGRSYGNGVYMANNAMTSVGYCGGRYPESTTWSKSELKITEALSLNEVVNKPDAFVSRSPFYVVADIDWIQTRYLFVRTTGVTKKEVIADEHAPLYVQDPQVIVCDETNHALKIPITALPKSRRPVQASQAVKKGGKKLKTTLNVTEEELEDAQSEISDDEDRVMIGDINACGEASVDGMEIDIDTSVTRFTPGASDLSKIKLLAEPSYATPKASQQLMKAFGETLKTQQKTKLSELGWYIDPNIENIYQWIVELHSFDKKLRLSEDMQMADVSSVVLEMRFSDNYPYSPPFVRVIQPRFLPFAQGGGGNVLDGGSLCLALLTSSGWSPVSSIESVLLQVRLAICDTERPAKLDLGRRGSSYAVGEAVAAYLRACRAHGWAVPQGFERIQKDA